ncbi:uncharacterized protein LOC126557266 [Anopheles maculipalpis]|uniref:uncharacterized protein LOC126557266 n=1 Tax=Anopheles maculipalpis TaxID=1496333 RepID=UPI0021598EAD|nr:uncharacterized protein LOC126557266 [Anopheles maculipalpis]
MGTDSVPLKTGDAIGVRQQRVHPIRSDVDIAAFGDTMKDSSTHTESYGQSFANGPGSAVKFPPVVGIYRPPAARRALNLAENFVHQLAPPAACEHPNDYGHLAPAPSRHQHQQAQVQLLLLQKTASGTEPDQLLLAPDSREGHLLRKDKAKTCEKTGPTGQEQLQTKLPEGAIGGSTDSSSTGNSTNRNSDGITSPSGRTNRPPRERRPDRAVYVPRARRSLTTPPTVAAATSQPQSLPAEHTSPVKGFLCTAAATNRVQQLPELGPSTGSVIQKTFQPVSSKEIVKLKESKRKVLELTTVGQLITSGNTDTLNCDTVIKEAPLNAHTTVGGEVSLDSFKKRNISLEENPQQRQELQSSITGLVEVEDCGQEISQEHSDTKPFETTVTMHRKNQRNNGSRNVRNETSTPSLLSTMLITDPSSAVKINWDENELRRISQEINRSNRRIMKQTFNSDVLEIDDPEPTPMPTVQKSAKVKRTPAATTATEKVEVGPKPTEPSESLTVVSNGTTTSNGSTAGGEEDEDDWESMYDDNGDCLNPKMLEELTTAVGKVSIETPQSDYKLFETKQAVLNEEEFPHVLEVSNFPAEFKTQDLMMLFSQYKETGFDIKWVDDTHALAVFSSSKIAAEVLTTGLSFGRVKPLAEATAESRSKARKCSSSLQPYRARPETCAAMARRMVTSALGVKLKTAPEERENERRVLREAKERKRLAAKQRDEVWDS